MKLQTKVTKWIKSIPHLQHIILALASLSYLIQVWYYSQQQRSLLDEGNFLYKGYLFATGTYIPYQDYGTWTNKMPLAFLVPGYFQKIFGPSLTTGRYYAFLLAILILIVAVILGFRLGGKWGGAFTAVLIALNPAPLKIFSMVFTEGLGAFLILLCLLFVLGKDRPLWQILVGSFLAGLIPVTRINLFPIMPIVIMYIFWEHGFKKGAYGLLVSLVPFVGMHIIYWPGIMRMWTQWSNEALTYFLDIDQLNPFSGESADVKEVTTLTRLLATFQVIRMQFPAILGALTVVSLWPKEWTDQSHKRSSIFLLFLFSVLLLLHFWVSVMLDITVFAFFRYIAYFYILGIFLIISTWKDWNYSQSLWKRLLIGIVSIFAVLGISVSNSEVSTYFGSRVIQLLQMRALSFENGKIVRAPWKWWETLQGQLGWEFSTSLKITGSILFFFSTLVILSGILFLYNRFIWKGETEKQQQIMPQLMVIFLIVGTVLSPTEFYGGGWNFYDCKEGVFDSYQGAANEISKYVENGDQIFWIGVDTQSVLLELSDMRSFQIYPQQLNAMNTFRLGGDTDTLTRIGLWNDEVAQAWVDGSQVLLFEEQALSRWFGDVYEQINLDSFKMVGETGDIGCTTNQRIAIFREK